MQIIYSLCLSQHSFTSEVLTSLLFAAGRGESILYRYITYQSDRPLFSGHPEATHCEARRQQPGMVGMTNSSLADHVRSSLCEQQIQGCLHFVSFSTVVDRQKPCEVCAGPPTDRQTSRPTLRPSDQPTDRPTDRSAPADRPTNRPTGRLAIRFPSGRGSRRC